MRLIHRLETTLGWDDLVLPDTVRGQLEAVLRGMRYAGGPGGRGSVEERLRPGYRALFHGPPGTGKRLAATLLGKSLGRDVFCIDLSVVASRYIGETEKNLFSLFDRAKGRGWVLFFDEADALFGKRTALEDGHDRYGREAASRLLQHIEDYDGLSILTLDPCDDLDDALLRRFNTVIHFPEPARRSVTPRETEEKDQGTDFPG